VFRVRDAVGLQPAQVTVATTLVAATAEVVGAGDLLLCSPKQAEDLGLHWRPVGEIRVARGFEVAAAIGDDAERVRARLREEIARCLGADPSDPDDGPADETTDGGARWRATRD
jgi:hypothetical protein